MTDSSITRYSQLGNGVQHNVLANSETPISGQHAERHSATSDSKHEVTNLDGEREKTHCMSVGSVNLGMAVVCDVSKTTTMVNDAETKDESSELKHEHVEGYSEVEKPKTHSNCVSVFSAVFFLSASVVDVSLVGHASNDFSVFILGPFGHANLAVDYYSTNFAANVADVSDVLNSHPSNCVCPLFKALMADSSLTNCVMVAKQNDTVLVSCISVRSMVSGLGPSEVSSCLI